MTHDPFCPISVPHVINLMCLCDVLTKVRVDEREQAAQRIAALVAHNLDKHFTAGQWWAGWECAADDAVTSITIVEPSCDFCDEPIRAARGDGAE